MVNAPPARRAPVTRPVQYDVKRGALLGAPQRRPRRHHLHQSIYQTGNAYLLRRALQSPAPILFILSKELRVPSCSSWINAGS